MIALTPAILGDQLNSFIAVFTIILFVKCIYLIRIYHPIELLLIRYFEFVFSEVHYFSRNLFIFKIPRHFFVFFPLCAFVSVWHEMTLCLVHAGICFVSRSLVSCVTLNTICMAALLQALRYSHCLYCKSLDNTVSEHRLLSVIYNFFAVFVLHWSYYFYFVIIVAKLFYCKL